MSLGSSGYARFSSGSSAWQYKHLSDNNISLFIQLFMRVKHHITALIVTLEAEISCFAVGHPPEARSYRHFRFWHCR